MNSAEATTVPTCSLDDLNREAATTFIRAHFPSLLSNDTPLEDALTTMRLAGSMGPRQVLTHAGLYLFGTMPQMIMPSWGVQVAKFSGTTLTSEVIEQQELCGPLPSLLEQTKQWVLTHGGDFPSLLDAQVPEAEFDPSSLHEALANALVHRDLRAPGTINVHLFWDRISVWSPGPHPFQQPLAHYLQRGGAPSLPRNPLIARFSQRLGVVQRLGRGIALMGRAEQRAPVEIQSSREGVKVTIYSAKVQQKPAMME